MPADTSPDGSSPSTRDDRVAETVAPQSTAETETKPIDVGTDSDSWRSHFRRHLPALAPALAAGVLVYVAYLVTHPYPALGGGFFLAMAETVLENGYHYPVHLPGYTPGGIPVAYPPLAFYGLAALLDLGLAPLMIARVHPGLVTIAAIVPTYLVDLQVLGSRARAGFLCRHVVVCDERLKAIFEFVTIDGNVVSELIVEVVDVMLNPKHD